MSALIPHRPSVLIALIYISFQQAILVRFACPELAAQLHAPVIIPD